MKCSTHILYTIILALYTLATPTQAQENTPKNDSKYLAGAVPEIDGKVVFSKTYNIPGMTQQEIFELAHTWMKNLLKKNNNNSRILFADQERGQIVGTGNHWMIFKETVLTLDQTDFHYQLRIDCQDETCKLQLSKIKYILPDGKEKQTAEEWIIDKYALNKTKTKLIPGLAKWRRKTVDYADELCLQLAQALQNNETNHEKPKAEEKSIINSGIMLIEKTPQKATTTQPIETTGTQPKTEEKHEITPSEINQNLFRTSEGKLVIIIGEAPFNLTMMTANAGGSIGKINGENVIFTILSPEQPHEPMDKAETYNVQFYPNGSQTPTIELECQKIIAPTHIEGMPRTYIGKIIKAIKK